MVRKLTTPGRAASLAALLAALALAGCGDDASDEPAATDGTDTAAETAATEDRGDFRVEILPADAEEDEDAAAFIEEAGTIAGIAEGMNEVIALPDDVNVVVQSGDDGPAYDPGSRTIVMNYPFVNYVAEVFAEADPDASEEELLTSVDNVVGFVLLHEIGHALVDQLEIPITGREEDSVDNLATVLVAEFVDEGGDIALDFADFFALIQEDPALLDEVDFWDEHSLDIQRANQTICLVYGSNPEAYGGLEEFIPEERGVRCPEEWEQIEASWLGLLEPHVKE